MSCRVLEISQLKLQIIQRPRCEPVCVGTRFCLQKEASTYERQAGWTLAALAISVSMHFGFWGELSLSSCCRQILGCRFQEINNYSMMIFVCQLTSSGSSSTCKRIYLLNIFGLLKTSNLVKCVFFLTKF